jgi:hypothetical protein
MLSAVPIGRERAILLQRLYKHIAHIVNGKIYIAGKQTRGFDWPQREALKSCIVYWLGFPRDYVFYIYAQTQIIPSHHDVSRVLFVALLSCSFVTYNICKILSLEG